MGAQTSSPVVIILSNLAASYKISQKNKSKTITRRTSIVYKCKEVFIINSYYLFYIEITLFDSSI